MATPPVFDTFPPAPNRGDAPADFSQKADTFVAALPPFALKMNQAISWMSATMATVLDYRDAAALSAQAAAQSAVTASQAIGAAQAARDAAAASATAAQVAAAAAGAAAGLPAVIGHGGQALVAKLDESGFELKAIGQAIGDVLETTRTPDATYLLCDTIYTRAAYPALFAIVGTQAEKDDGVNPTAITHGLAAGSYVILAGKDDVFVAVGVTTNSETNGTAGRSTDKGLTWSPIPSLVGGYSLKSLATNGNGTWVATMNRGSSASNVGWVARSDDNGVTWAIAELTVGYGYNGQPPLVVYDGFSKFIIYTAGQTTTRGAVSTNGGVSWTEIVLPSNIQSLTVDFSGNLYVVRSPSGTQQELLRAPVSTIVFSRIVNRSGSSGVVFFGAPAHGQGVSAFVMDGQLFVSTDGGKQWAPKLISSAAAINITPYGYIVVGSSDAILMSSDFGETWYERPLGGLQLAISGNITTTGVVVVSGVSTTFSRSARLYNYDVATQFKTPARKAPKGYKAYIKGKLA
ncbi:WD40/YVTN/BNR-like repeat-containing protein [Pseudomonas syringae]|uniref:Exo-alpha-sialidase n=1 Tax=Pseudomonas syringae TaxID=317 RepID=A0A085V6S3_PSESX|nr:sialidase family protein [Pseudomonas syringae]KFE51136.1 hypothetical protein IV02_14145 [Pseudomonas syringae]